MSLLLPLSHCVHPSVSSYHSFFPFLPLFVSLPFSLPPLPVYPFLSTLYLGPLTLSLSLFFSLSLTLPLLSLPSQHYRPFPPYRYFSSPPLFLYHLTLSPSHSLFIYLFLLHFFIPSFISLNLFLYSSLSPFLSLSFITIPLFYISLHLDLPTSYRL